ncbi:DNRLRE domain-containing protein [Fulvivirgaceae bacterium BMA10]|uniref:DNRLRE domain-containing protein n=1 Tax=Splendidivirga corallicola TaxID=3051826 RepID=A0ABT8KTU3_9BACT|nr:DNRLRE domain-containing protein [Fulvivirgaceae bacterium BMA10]
MKHFFRVAFFFLLAKWISARLSLILFWALALMTTVHAQNLPMVKHIDDLPFYVPPRDFLLDGNSQELVNYPGTDYPGSNQMAFDSQNRPYLYIERTAAYAGYLLTLRNGVWTKIHFRDVVNAAMKSQFNAPSDYDYVFSIQAHSNSSIHIDDDNALYMVIWVANESATTAGRCILVYSSDITVTNPAFTVHRLFSETEAKRSAIVEVKTGYNDTSVTPAIGVFGDNFGVYIPTKNPDGSLNLGQRIHLSNEAVTRFVHSGGRAWAVSKNGKVFVAWQGSTIPNTTTPENAFWIAEIDRSTRVATTKYLGLGEGFNSPKPDNHNFPTLSIDSQGYLHYIKGSHGPGGSLDFHYGRSPNPYAISGTWTFHDWEASDATYNSTVITTSDKIICTARRTWQWMGFSTKSNSSSNNWSTWKNVFVTDPPFGNYDGGSLYNAPAQREVVDKNGNVYYQACLRNFDFSTEKEYFAAQTTVSFNANVDSVRIMTRYDYLKRIINGKNVQRITFEPADVSLFDSPVTLSASTNVPGVSITYEVISGPATVSGNVLTLTGIGEVVLKAKNSGNANYYGDEVVRTIQVTDNTYSLLPEADAHVRSGAYGNDNYGTNNALIIKKSNDGDAYTRQGYYRFDLSSITGIITSAKLKLVPSGNSANVGSINVAVKFVTDDSWSETGITWNNMPAVGSVLDTKAGSTTATEWDVTTQAQTEKSGDGKLSLHIESTINNGEWIHYHSKEAFNASVRPVLIVATQPAGTTTTDLSAEADSFVRSGSYGNDNYGTGNILIIKKSFNNDSYNRQAYFRFDLTSITGTITSAKLKLVPSGNSANVASSNFEAKFVSDDSWNETGITWNNKPASGGLLDTKAGSTTTTEWDVTAQAQSEKAGDGKLSLLVQGVVNNGEWIHYHSKEASVAANRPVLVVTYQSGSSGSGGKAEPSVFFGTHDNSRISIYPNPVKNNFTVHSKEKIDHIGIINLSGQLVQKFENINSNIYDLNVENLQKGMFLLRIIAQSGSSHVHKIIKR